MSASTTTITIRTKKEIKVKAQAYFDSLGISLSSAVNMFLNDVISNGSVNFSIKKQHVGELFAVDPGTLTPEQMADLQELQSLSDDDLHTLTTADYVDNKDSLYKQGT